jgi:hypothetical protein
VKQDRLSALRQRLKRGSFEFGALLEGVSTLEDDSRRVTEEPLPPLEPTAKVNGSHAPASATLVEERVSSIAAEAPETAFVPEESAAGRPQLSMLEDALPQTVPANGSPDRLRAALDSLGCRFLQEMGSLRTSLAANDIEQSGFHLAHVNQLLELLRDIDPDGKTSRKLGSIAAPPPGRSWPASCWSVVEFAGSPISGLLPPKADETFVRDLLYAAWGVTFSAPA